MNIAGREIGIGHPPYVVAEISGNHGGSIHAAETLIRYAKDYGADAVKLQAYTPDTITLAHDTSDFYVKDGPWRGRHLFDLYRETHTPFGWFPKLFDFAREIGITIFASVFDRSSVDMLEKLDCPAYKIASMEIVDTPLIRYAAATGKPTIISTGMATEDEIWDAVVAAPHSLFLHCVSNYPTSLKDAALHKLCRRVGWGVSDHTRGIEVPIAAAVIGATLIEKHLGCFHQLGEDAAFSLTPQEFRRMADAVRALWQSMRNSSSDESASQQLRRSLYAVADIKQGEPFTEANVRSIRPSYGLPPKMLPQVLTMYAARDICYGTALSKDMLSNTSSGRQDDATCAERSAAGAPSPQRSA